MQGRFEIRLAEGERGDLRECAAHAGLSAAAIVRFGMRWALNRLDVLANGGSQKTEQDIAALLDELRADPRTAPAAGALEAALAALDREGDANRSAAALFDLIGLVAAEPLPLAEKLQLLGDLLAFEGRLTIRRQIEPAQISQSVAG
jgi:predicted ATPase with chaperone activity